MPCARTWWQGGGGALKTDLQGCAREGCAHDGAALPLTCVLKKYESETLVGYGLGVPFLRSFLRDTVLVYQPLIISAEPPQVSRYSASDARSFTECSDESASAGGRLPN